MGNGLNGYNQLFNADSAIYNFLHNDSQKIMAILGSDGAGKSSTLFYQYIQQLRKGQQPEDAGLQEGSEVPCKSYFINLVQVVKTNSQEWEKFLQGVIDDIKRQKEKTGRAPKYLMFVDGFGDFENCKILIPQLF